MTIAETFPDGLRTRQVVGGLQIQQKRRMLLADQPGAGKTAQALLALELDGQMERPGYILITTTMTACQLTWASELRERVATQHDVVICDLTFPGINKRTGQVKKTMPTLKERDEQLQAAVMEADDLGLPLIVLANFEALRWKMIEPPKVPTLFELEWSSIIIDESHLVLPTQYDHRNEVSQFWYGLLNLQCVEDPIRLAMSGTPDRGKLENRYGTWKFLNPRGFTDFWAWARSTFVLTAEEWGGQSFGKLIDPQRWANTDKMWMLRRTKAEMFAGLPEKQWAGRGGIDLPMTPSQQIAYDNYCADLKDMEQQLRLEGGDGETPAQKKALNKARALKLTFALRSRQMAIAEWDFIERENPDGTVMTTGVPKVQGPEHSNKLAWILEFLEARGHIATNWDPSLGKVVIVSYFTMALNWLKLELDYAGIPSEVLSGETSFEQKQAIEQRFQRGDLRVVLLSGYLGVSINLDAADDMVFLDLVHDPDKLEQAEDRIHRASRMHQVTYWRLVSKGTADVVVLMEADTRYRDTRKTYDGDRGVQFARMMLGEKVAA